MSREVKKIVFEEPIIIGKKEIKEVTMRVPKGKDSLMVASITNTIEKDFVFISNLCNLNATVEEMGEIDLKEILQLQAALRSFL